jgi:acetyltransferase-like isoleucine patch superfamily enzyme
MSYSIKYLASRILWPIAKTTHEFQQRWQRLWAYTKLATQVKTPLDASVVVDGCPEIQGTGQIYLGKNLYLYRELYLETREQGVIVIGDDVVISRGVHIVAFNRVEIGKGTMIGEYTSIRDANHRSGYSNLRASGHDSKPITIGSQVWIGRGVTILMGVTIGDHAVIGSNAVVNKDVSAHTLAVGVPARSVKQL